MTRKFTLTAYASKDVKPEGAFFDLYGEVGIPELYRRRGRDFWNDADYPPQRVRVTLEWLDVPGEEVDE